ncbi:7-carboxy-7-deazaguanine synthase QueE [Selenomonadales bacterium OttesenSCG-928-I06]|nr:7-carboxy-7-deazaguanine synthase QueE [Selenomonadales bacterium OttesenSCG-928-I06]
MNKNPNEKNVNLIEVFSSFQGEGLLVGSRQVFVRLASCNLNCKYCDTEILAKDVAKLEMTPGKLDFSDICNPVLASYLANHVNKMLFASKHHSVSITGGEPLIQFEALKDLLPGLNAPIYLETNGILFEELQEVLPFIEYISMDIKLPSSLIFGKIETPKNYWQEHAKFLEIAFRKNVFIKIVLTAKTTFEEVEKAIEIINSVNKKIPLVFQPVTPVNGVESLSIEKTIAFFELAQNVLDDVRIIPQTHKIIGVI